MTSVDIYEVYYTSKYIVTLCLVPVSLGGIFQDNGSFAIYVSNTDIPMSFMLGHGTMT